MTVIINCFDNNEKEVKLIRAFLDWKGISCITKETMTEKSEPVCTFRGNTTHGFNELNNIISEFGD